MCACEAGFTCTRCWPGLVGARDWRDLPLRHMADVGEWTEAEIVEARWEQTISSHDFDSPFKDAA